MLSWTISSDSAVADEREGETNHARVFGAIQRLESPNTIERDRIAIARCPHRPHDHLRQTSNQKCCKREELFRRRTLRIASRQNGLPSLELGEVA